MRRPFIRPYAYSILILLCTTITDAALFHSCYYFTTAAAINLLVLINYCEQVYFQVQVN